MDQHAPVYNVPAGGRPLQDNDAARLSGPLKRMSLSTASQTPLPPSPAVNSPRSASRAQHRAVSSPSNPNTPPAILRRASSVHLNDQRAASPSLLRKASTSSFRGNDPPATPRRPSSRLSRSPSVNLQTSPTMGFKHPLATSIEQPPPPTAADVAQLYFRRDLATHEGAKSNTVVILHDSCYGHRYSRPKTTKSNLSLIVERPERILAGTLGLSAAYVRLGERHSNGQNAPHPNRSAEGSLPFKIRRTSRSVSLKSPFVANVHGVKWMEELKDLCDNAATKLATTGKELSRTEPSKPAAGQPAKDKFHESDLYLCSESLNAFEGALGGVCDGIDAVFLGQQTGSGPSQAFVCIRPPGHHCSADWPSGFCWLNNVHVGIEYAAQTHGLTHAAIVDFDLHHGDGSQEITWQHNSKIAKQPKNAPFSKKTSIGYFSLHDINSYPCEYGDEQKVQNASLCMENAHGQTIWNIHLQTWKTEDEFWALYENRYVVLIEKARAFLKTHTNRLRSAPNQPPPKAAIFISAGFDASEWEGQGMQRHKVNVPTEFYARFTQDVVKLAREAGTGADGRIISVLEGGYSDRALASGVLSHMCGLAGDDVSQFKKDQVEASSLGYEMGQRFGALSLEEHAEHKVETLSAAYNPDWWHTSNLALLEAAANIAPPPAPPKKTKPLPPGNYSSPTQSFTAKVVDPAKVHRTGRDRLSLSPSRPPTPPPPEVEWPVAAYELSKLLIPSDRQTQSCRPEELAPQPKVKKERQPTAEPMPPPVRGRELRDRKAKASAYLSPVSDDDASSVRSVTVSASDRRKTIADLPPNSDASAGAQVQPRAPAPRRRSSIASSVSSVSGVSSGVPTARPSGVPSRPNSRAGIQVKKARAVNNAPDPKSANAGGRPPVPRIPSSSGRASVAGQRAKNGAAPKDVSGDADMDALSSGLKKITLKVPSEEEYAARAQKTKGMEAAEKKKPVTKSTARKAPAARTTKATSTGKKSTAKDIKPDPATTPAEAPSEASAETPAVVSTKDVPIAMPSPVAPPSVVPDIREDSAPKMEIHDLPTFGSEIAPPLPAEILSAPILTPEHLSPANEVPGTIADITLPTTSPPRPDTPPPPPPLAQASVDPVQSAKTTLNETQFVPYEPPTTTAQQRPVNGSQAPDLPQQLIWTEPNSDPAVNGGPISPGRKQKANLPVFSANGIIPFAQPPVGGPRDVEVPAGAPAHTNTDSMNVESAPSAKKEEETMDIWEVPISPAK